MLSFKNHSHVTLVNNLYEINLITTLTIVTCEWFLKDSLRSYTMSGTEKNAFQPEPPAKLPVQPGKTGSGKKRIRKKPDPEYRSFSTGKLGAKFCTSEKGRQNYNFATLTWGVNLFPILHNYQGCITFLVYIFWLIFVHYKIWPLNYFLYGELHSILNAYECKNTITISAWEILLNFAKNLHNWDAVLYFKNVNEKGSHFQVFFSKL